MTPLSVEERARLLKPVDSAWTVLFIDPIVVRVLPAIAPVRSITPTRLTVLAHALGLVSAAMFLSGQLVAGAVLFEVRFALDCTDGKLARLRGQSSRFGALLDAKGDLVVLTATFAAASIREGHGWLAAALAATYVGSFLLKELRDDRYREAGRTRTIDRVAQQGVGRWLHDRRIFPTVTSVEVEHVALFVAPLVTAAGLDVVVPGLVLAAVFFAFQAIRFGVGAARA